MSYEFPIDYSKVQEFARAVHAEQADHAGRDAVIPPTMLTSGRMIWEPQEQSGFRKLGFDRRRILHGEEEFVYHGPLPRAGETLIAKTRIGETFTKPGKRGGEMTFAKMITEFRDESGRLVAEQNSTIIQTATSGNSKGDK